VCGTLTVSVKAQQQLSIGLQDYWCAEITKKRRIVLNYLQQMLNSFCC